MKFKYKNTGDKAIVQPRTPFEYINNGGAPVPYPIYNIYVDKVGHGEWILCGEVRGRDLSGVMNYCKRLEEDPVYRAAMGM